MYSQEMFKTELHNKWQEIGTCPYDDHRQFARDTAELCTLIRHSGYETVVCRMILAGDMCPYGLVRHHRS